MGDDERIMQRMKSVTVLEFCPGNADSPDGAPIGILTIEHNGEVEEPLMIQLGDLKTLLHKTVGILATHGDEFCRHLVQQYFAADDDSK
jgi:hypothetical protein